MWFPFWSKAVEINRPWSSDLITPAISTLSIDWSCFYWGRCTSWCRFSVWLCILTWALTSFFSLSSLPYPITALPPLLSSHLFRLPWSTVSFLLYCSRSNFQRSPLPHLFSISVLHLCHLIYLFYPLPYCPCSFLLLSAALSQCDQDQCIQSTKFVLQAAATPLLQQQSSEPVILTASPENGGSLPGRTSLTLAGPCTSLPLGQPTPPTSTPSLSCHDASDMLPIHGHGLTHNHSHSHQEPVAHHHFLTPEEVPSPPGMLPCGSPLGHSHTMQAGFFNPASQDSLHEDSVRGLVKLSSVWQWIYNPSTTNTSHHLSPEKLASGLLCHFWATSFSWIWQKKRCCGLNSAARNCGINPNRGETICPQPLFCLNVSAATGRDGCLCGAVYDNSHIHY